jgi:hypothetical protein
MKWIATEYTTAPTRVKRTVAFTAVSRLRAAYSSSMQPDHVSNFDQTPRATGPRVGFAPERDEGHFPRPLSPQAFPPLRPRGRRLGARSALEAGQTEKDCPQWPTNYSVQGLSALLLGRSRPLVRCCSFWQYSRPLCRVLRSIEPQMRRSLAEVDLYQHLVYVGARAAANRGVPASNTPTTSDPDQNQHFPGCAVSGRVPLQSG